MSKATIKGRNKSLLDRIGSALTAMQPENPAHGTFEHARSTETSPTFIRYMVTTGIRAFDDRVGGLPVGKAIELCGLPKSGKTNMAVRVCVRAQQGFIYERVQLEDGCIELKQLEPGTFNVTTIYYDNEGSLSDFYQRQVDGTVMDGEIVQCEVVELLWKTMDRVMEEVEKEEEATGVIQFLFVIIDTVGSMTTKLELEAAWGKQDFPRVPYQIKAGFKAMTARMQRENVLLIGLNHVTRKMTAANRGHVAYKGWLYDSPGGMAFSYFATVQIYFEMLQVKYCLAGKGEADGLLVYFMTQKNRLLPPLRQGRMALLFGLREKDTQRVIKEGGFKDGWSMLETLIFSKAAKVTDTGAITFRFEKYGLEFNAKKDETATLEERDGETPPPAAPQRRGARRNEPPPRQKDPRISSRLKWPEFYEQNHEALDALYNLVTERCLAGSESIQLPNGDDDDDDEEGEE